tara:strand:+ start:253 stop:540 length:288 start_codon:yes stop_codon:yes gene_type:complete
MSNFPMNNLPTGIPTDQIGWHQETRDDIESFVHDCYDNDIVWDAEPGKFIKFDTLLDKFTFFWEGHQKYFDSYETAEDWLKLNQARTQEAKNNGK